MIEKKRLTLVPKLFVITICYGPRAYVFYSTLCSHANSVGRLVLLRYQVWAATTLVVSNQDLATIFPNLLIKSCY
jgi:hypothetical protein